VLLGIRERTLTCGMNKARCEFCRIVQAILEAERTQVAFARLDRPARQIVQVQIGAADCPRASPIHVFPLAAPPNAKVPPTSGVASKDSSAAFFGSMQRWYVIPGSASDRHAGR